MIQPVGHFRVWRELYNKPIWLNSTLEQKVILMTLMAMANFKSKEWEWKGEKYSVEAGQFITSLESIKANTGNCVSTQNVRTALRRFEKLEFLTNESTKEGRLITLVNWRDYQYTEDEPNIATNKDLTKSQQRPNKDLTPREEGKKDKKEKNDKEVNDFRSVYEHYINLDLINHRTFTDDMRKAISSAMKNNKYSIEYCMTLLDRHKQIVERTKDDGKYAIKPRSLEQFFGQKVFNAKHLICSEYDEGGDKYLKLQEVPKEKKDNSAAILAKMMEEQELE